MNRVLFWVAKKIQLGGKYELEVKWTMPPSYLAVSCRVQVVLKWSKLLS